jgi:hypothetical protein
VSGNVGTATLPANSAIVTLIHLQELLDSVIMALYLWHYIGGQYVRIILITNSLNGSN